MKAKKTEMGMNRTGMDMAPVQSRAMKDNMEIIPSSSNGSITHLRGDYIRQGETLGTIPMPGSLTGAAKAVMQRFSGNRAEVLIDHLGDRLAFERSGTRLYDIVISKCEALGDQVPAELIEELRHQRNEEENHFHWLVDAMREVGADPTAMTPAADVSAVASMGLFKVAADPRSNLVQTLKTLLIAELVDRDGWDVLINLTEEMGLDEHANQFRQALAEEEEHLMRIRNWTNKLTLGDAKAGEAAA